MSFLNRLPLKGKVLSLVKEYTYVSSVLTKSSSSNLQHAVLKHIFTFTCWNQNLEE